MLTDETESESAALAARDEDEFSDEEEDYDDAPTSRQVQAEQRQEKTIEEAARAWDNFRVLNYEMRCWEKPDTDEYREERGVAYFNAGNSCAFFARTASILAFSSMYKYRPM